MPISSPVILRIAVPSPLRRTFDYLPPTKYSNECLEPGVRVRVPFGRGQVIGVLLEVVTEARIDPSRLKAAIEVLDDRALLAPPLMKLGMWASDYYHHPPGEVFSHLLPALLRQGRAPVQQRQTLWVLTGAGQAVDPAGLTRAPRQAALLQLFHDHPDGLTSQDIAAHFANHQSPLQGVVKKGWVERRSVAAPPGPAHNSGQQQCADVQLNPAQTTAVETLSHALGTFGVHVLEGVTGSGKTEVYLQIIQRIIDQGYQALLLLPEIGLTPQMIARLRARFTVPVVIYHSGLSDRERLDAWIMARSGAAPLIVGTRSAVFLPLQRPGIIIVDEEHDLSYKQQEGFRYHARDVAVVRAQQDGIPILLGSATPSIETLYNVQRGRYHHLSLPDRAGNAVPPELRLLDLRHRPLDDGLADNLLHTVGQHLARGNQVLLFLNRRGYAPTILCHDCGWVAQCHRCDTHLVLHRQDQMLRCHHCAGQSPMPAQCPHCHSTELRVLGQGTERIEQTLQRHFPGHEILRIDRDSTRRKGALQDLLGKAHDGQGRILIGTQMLAKGHHLPDVTLVGIVNADYGLFSADFRASERMAQTIIQVAGRAGRSDKQGTVLIQTHHADHPHLQALTRHGYAAFAKTLLEERAHAELPPYSSLALLRAEATQRDAPQAFLHEACEHARHMPAAHHVQLLGPVPAPMERRAGRYRAQLLVQAAQRRQLHGLLKTWAPQLETLPSARRVRWSLDVDPMELL